MLGSGGIFALIEDNNNKSGFSVQKLTVGDIALVPFEDKGESNSDFLSNDTDFILNIDCEEPFTSVFFERKIEDGDFAPTSKIQDISTDGKYTYRAIVTDQAGNLVITNERVVNIETVVPSISEGSFTLGEDDTGFSNSDLTTNITSPTIEFVSESGLRAFSTKLFGRKKWNCC